MLTIALAVRGGPAAKSRCAPALSPRERADLAQSLLQDMLVALHGFALVVATPTPAIVALAKRHGARTLLEPRAKGLNAAFRRVLQVHKDGAIALVPGDLPFLTAAEVEEASSLLTRLDVVIAPSRRGGTGGLFLRNCVRIAPAFGVNSASRHRAAARAAGLSCAIYEARGFRNDIDTPDDLSDLRRERQRGFRDARTIRQ